MSDAGDEEPDEIQRRLNELRKNINAVDVSEQDLDAIQRRIDTRRKMANAIKAEI